MALREPIRFGLVLPTKIDVIVPKLFPFKIPEFAHYRTTATQKK